eukprot:1586500-Prymnesium_polylepis.2
MNDSLAAFQRVLCFSVGIDNRICCSTEHDGVESCTKGVTDMRILSIPEPLMVYCGCKDKDEFGSGITSSDSRNGRDVHGFRKIWLPTDTMYSSTPSIKSTTSRGRQTTAFVSFSGLVYWRQKLDWDSSNFPR